MAILKVGGSIISSPQLGGEGGRQLALALVRDKCAISDRRARREKQYFNFLLRQVYFTSQSF
jgi:hypothetical protein